MTATKKIFISDIHMGDERSFAGSHPYGWFRNNIPYLADFLKEVCNSPEVAEVVVLGDLFDTWVIPTDQDPLTSFSAICNNPANKPVVDALRQLAQNKTLTLVAGNHDMVPTTTELDTWQQFVDTCFPGISYCSDQKLPNGVYRSGTLVAEHGSRYALFNASDTWTNPPSFLPIGYFISRLVTYKVSQTGDNTDFHDVLESFVNKFKDSPEFIKDLFCALAADAGLNDDSPINMKGIAGFPGSVGEVGSLYEKLIEKWDKERVDIDWGRALVGDVGHLYPAALHIYFPVFGSHDQDIVIFGHTHKVELKKTYILREAPAVADIHYDLPCKSIYANCGTWVDSAAFCTYIETEVDAVAGRHYVRALSYHPSKTLLQQGFVKL